MRKGRERRGRERRVRKEGMKREKKSKVDERRKGGEGRK